MLGVFRDASNSIESTSIKELQDGGTFRTDEFADPPRLIGSFSHLHGRAVAPVDRSLPVLRPPNSHAVPPAQTGKRGLVLLSAVVVCSSSSAVQYVPGRGTRNCASGRWMLHHSAISPSTALIFARRAGSLASSALRREVAMRLARLGTPSERRKGPSCVQLLGTRERVAGFVRGVCIWVYYGDGAAELGDFCENRCLRLDWVSAFFLSPVSHASFGGEGFVASRARGSTEPMGRGDDDDRGQLSARVFASRACVCRDA